MTQAVKLAQLGSPGISTGFKNRIINGAMVIDQRNAGASVTASATSTYTYTLDRWAYYATAASKFTVQQNAGSVTPPVGFSNYLGITSSSAYTVGSSDTFFIQQTIEGLNCQDLAWGTVNAKTVTLSFWVYSSLTGTFGGTIRAKDPAPSPSYPFSYTISSANTWTQISVTIAGPTTGTWTSNNGQYMQVGFNLGSGSTFSGTAGSWQASNLIAPTGATSVVGTNGATFYITGVQLEVGTTATDFEYRDYGRELMMCQRYFESSFNYGTAPLQGGTPGTNIFAGFTGVCYSAGALRTNPIYYKAEKRTSPTVTFYRPGSTWGGTTDGRWSGYNTSSWVGASATSVTDGFSGTTGFGVDLSVSGTSAGSAYLCMGGWSSSAEL